MSVLTFKIKRFSLSGVGNRGDSDTKVHVRVTTLAGDIYQMSASPGSACGGDSH